MKQIARVFQETFLFLGSLVRPTVRSLRDNSGLAVLSVALAFALWIFVTDAENPTRTRVLPVDIPVQPVNVPQDVAVAGQLPPVRVRVTVAEDVFDSLTPADFEATVDLEGLTVGEYDLPVEVRPLTSRGGLRVEAVLPETIAVSLAQLIGKSVPVVIEVQGEPPSGFTMSVPEVDDETVLVTGPEEQVNQVAQASAAIDMSNRTETVDQAVRLVPKDNRGVLIQGLNVEPSVTQVRIDVEQEKFSRSVAVSPQITGVPADGYNVVSVSVTPPAITLRGEEAFISGTVSVPTKPVDIGDSTDDVVRTVSLDLPPGAEVTGGVPVVTVTVRIDPALGSLNFELPVTASGLGDSVSIAGALPTVVVNVTGELPALRALTAADITAAVNLSGRGPGAYTLPVETAVPAGLTVHSVTPAEIQVTLGAR